jgi:hypothetical protein
VSLQIALARIADLQAFGAPPGAVGYVRLG